MVALMCGFLMYWGLLIEGGDRERERESSESGESIVAQLRAHPMKTVAKVMRWPSK